ncbi:MAG: nuclear transport factor 2 family protein [Acidimicrobiia bacterium]
MAIVTDHADAIRTLIHRYAELLDLGDLDGVAALFARSTWRAAGHEVVLRGSAEARAAYEGVILYDGVPRTKHQMTNVTIELARDESTAAARTYFTVLQATPELPLQPIIAGRYEDAFARDDAGWYFTDRLIIPDLLGDLSRHMQPAFMP